MFPAGSGGLKAVAFLAIAGPATCISRWYFPPADWQCGEATASNELGRFLRAPPRAIAQLLGIEVRSAE